MEGINRGKHPFWWLLLFWKIAGMMDFTFVLTFSNNRSIPQ